MSREIKFRGKRKDNGGWVYGDLVRQVGLTIFAKDFIQVCDEGEFQSFEVERESIGQYTGLLDKNGIEIWEGSICKVSKMPDNNGKGDLGQVFHEDGEFRLGTPKNRWYRLNDMTNYHQRRTIDGVEHVKALGNLLEIIGNIAENPELINSNE